MWWCVWANLPQTNLPQTIPKSNPQDGPHKQPTVHKTFSALYAGDNSEFEDPKNAPLKGVTLTSSDARLSLRVRCSNSNAHCLHCRQIRIYKKPLWLHAAALITVSYNRLRLESQVQTAGAEDIMTQMTTDAFPKSLRSERVLWVPHECLVLPSKKITEVMQTTARLHHFSIQGGKTEEWNRLSSILCGSLLVFFLA